MIVHLPNGGVLPIDSKVPLDAYLDAVEISDIAARAAKLSVHAKAMRARIHELGQKSYWLQFQESPDFVVMFVPNESCLGAAFESDPELLEYAMKSRVLVSSPVNLLALLRTVAYGWQQEQIAENAQVISSLGKSLYNRIFTLAGHFSDIGKGLDQTVDAYNRAVGSFERRVLVTLRRFKDLGASTGRDIEKISMSDKSARPFSRVMNEQKEERKDGCSHPVMGESAFKRISGKLKTS